MQVTNVNSYYLRVIFFGVTPILLSLASSLVWLLVGYTCKRRDLKFKITPNIKVTCYTIILLLHPVITTSAFSLFSCVSYEDGESYLRRDMEIQCWSPSHVKFSLGIGLPLILVWTIGFPLYIYREMYKRRQSFDYVENLKEYGLFYVGLSN